MKKMVSILLLVTLSLTVFVPFASADSGLFSLYSDAQLRELYEAIREEMIARGLPLAQEVTLREGKYIIGEDILLGTCTLRCVETSGDTYGSMYSSLGDLYSSFDSELGGLMGSLGGMMGNMVNTEVEIIGDYGTVLKSFELKAGDSVRLTLNENTALQISDGTCVLIAD